jgi:hypothetical protein
VLLDHRLLAKQLVYSDQRTTLLATSKHQALRFIHSFSDWALTCQSRPHFRHATVLLLHSCRMRSVVTLAISAASLVVRYCSSILVSQSVQ